MAYIPFTEEEKLLANSVDLPKFLRNHGEKLERAGRESALEMQNRNSCDSRSAVCTR
jgi:hypothetical protein